MEISVGSLGSGGVGSLGFSGSLGLLGVLGKLETGLLLLLEELFLPEEDVFEELPPEIVLSPTIAEDTFPEIVTLEFGVFTETFSAEISTFSTEPLPVTTVSFPASVILTFLIVPSAFNVAFAATSTLSILPLTVRSTGEDTVTFLKVPSKIEGVLTFVVSTVLP